MQSYPESTAGGNESKNYVEIGYWMKSNAIL